MRTSRWTLDASGLRIERYGTPLLVLGDYDFDRPGPWTRLATDANATTITLDEVRRALELRRDTLLARVR